MNSSNETTNGREIIYIIIDDPQSDADVIVEKLGEVVGEVVISSEPPEQTQAPPTPADMLILCNNYLKEDYESKETIHLLKEWSKTGWRPEATRPPARPRRPSRKPCWFRIRSFCVRRGWH